MQNVTGLERCTLWNTLKFQSSSLLHIRDVDVGRETKGITNETIVSKATMVSKIIVATM
jgi:hypothetical protein